MARPLASLDRRILDSNKGSTWLRNYRSWLAFGSGTKRTTPDALIYGDFGNVHVPRHVRWSLYCARSFGITALGKAIGSLC